MIKGYENQKIMLYESITISSLDSQLLTEPNHKIQFG